MQRQQHQAEGPAATDHERDPSRSDHACPFADVFARSASNKCCRGIASSTNQRSGRDNDFDDRNPEYPAKRHKSGCKDNLGSRKLLRYRERCDT